MYKVLQPYEKLVYLAFWVDEGTDGAVRLASGTEVDAMRFAGAIGKLKEKGLLSRKERGYRAGLPYLAEMIDRDNHLYPERKLNAAEKKELISFLGSEGLRNLARRNFGHARALAGEGRDVLAGFFWRIFSEPFSVICAYKKVFGRKKIPKGCATALRKSGKFSEDAIALALDSGLANSFPENLVDFLKWNVNQNPHAPLAEEIFRAQKSKTERGGQ